jgi:hypothetical protein
MKSYFPEMNAWAALAMKDSNAQRRHHIATRSSGFKYSLSPGVIS